MAGFENRLGDLVGGGSTNPFDSNDVENPTPAPAAKRSSVKAKPNHDAFTTSFFRDVGSINKSLSSIRTKMDTMSENHTRLLNEISEAKKKDLSNDLERLMDETGALIKGSKDRLDAMGKDISKLKSEGKDQNKIRMTSSMHGTLSRKLMDQLKEYNEAQIEFKNQTRDKLERQVKIVNPDATPDQVNDILDGTEGGVFTQDLMRAAPAQVAAVYQEAQEKNRDIQRIEAQLIELNQLFKDVQTLVEAQGEMIDSIESNVGAAVVFVEKGNRELVKATRSQKASRKKMCCIGVIILVIGVAIVITTQM